MQSISIEPFFGSTIQSTRNMSKGEESPSEAGSNLVSICKRTNNTIITFCILESVLGTSNVLR